MTEPLDDLRHVDEADVWKGDRRAGRLRREGDDVVWLPDLDAPTVATTLAAGHGEVRASAGSVPPFFAGLLPEGARLTALVTATRTSVDDHLTLLLAVGQDAVGDVRVVPAGAAPVEPPVLVDGSRRDGLDLQRLFEQAVDPAGVGRDRHALPGVQPKVSASMVSAPMRTSVGPAVLKLTPSEYPRLAENEDFFLRMAAACGLPVPEHRLLHDDAGRSALLVRRFDREVGPGGTTARRLAQEDACQLLGVYPSSKYRLKTEDVVRRCQEVVAAGDGSPALAGRRLLELVAFSYLVGNGDLHGKNVSVRWVPGRGAEVTPVYDVLSTQPYLSFADPMALSFYGWANRLTRVHLLEAGVRLGVPERALASALDRVVGTAEPWVDRVGEIGLPDRLTGRLADLLRARRSELAG